MNFSNTFSTFVPIKSQKKVKFFHEKTLWGLPLLISVALEKFSLWCAWLG